MRDLTKIDQARQRAYDKYRAADDPIWLGISGALAWALGSEDVPAWLLAVLGDGKLSMDEVVAEALAKTSNRDDAVKELRFLHNDHFGYYLSQPEAEQIIDGAYELRGQG